MEVWIATGNKGKLNEMRIHLEKLEGLVIHHQGELGAFNSPPENGKTYLENARIKTRALKAVKPEFWVMGEDTGLEVEGLGNLPGIHTARYAGNNASDAENRAKMLKMLQIRNISNRAAKFVCTMVAYSPSGEEFIFTGELKGQISPKERGDLGFGYDSIFIPEGQTQTLAEIGPAFKNANSHRAIALKQFIEKIR
jgi:XTP/dITP diphosphohydrolase